MKKLKFFYHFKNIFFSKKKLVIVIILILSAGGAYVYFQQSGDNQDLRLAEVKRQDLKTEVSASGILTGKQTTDLKFLLGGKVNYLDVEIGDSVKKGQLISGLDTQELQITLQQARNTYRDKQAAAEKAEDDVKDHSKDETYAQKQTRTAAQVARDNAYDAVKAAQRDLRDALLFSPIDGVVTQVNKLPGQAASTADTVVQIVDSSKIYFDAEVDEADIDKVSLGQKAEVTLNSNPDKVLLGDVAQIYPSTKTTSSGSTVVIVRIDLTNSEVRFINSINGQASIILSEAKGVLAIPAESIIDEDKVIVKDGSSYKEVRVLKGLESDEGVEIKDGLSEMQIVVINPQAVKSVKRI